MFALYTLKSIRKIYLPCILVFKLMVQIFICLVVSSQSVSQNVVHRSVALESLGKLIKDSFPYMRISFPQVELTAGAQLRSLTIP